MPYSEADAKKKTKSSQAAQLSELEDLRAENEALRREVLHRSSNNLQLVSSLLDLSGKRFKEPGIVNRLSEIRAKIRAMGLIQAQVYDYQTRDKIDMERFLQNLILQLGQIFYRKNVAAHLDCQPVCLPLEQAVPLALVFNELVTNAFKHPFQKRKSGRIEVGLSESDSGTIEARVRDNGTGLPPEIDIYQTETLGLKLVRNIIIIQFKGKLKIRRQRGTGFRIEIQRTQV